MKSRLHRRLPPVPVRQARWRMTVPEIVQQRRRSAPARKSAPTPSAIDVGSIGAVCNISLNEQGLLAGLVAEVPGLAAKPIESVENACASGGQAILSVIHKLLLGHGEVGLAVGFEKMRDDDGKMDGKLVGKVLGLLLPPRRAGRQDLRLPAPLRRGDGPSTWQTTASPRRTSRGSPSPSTPTRSTTRTPRCRRSQLTLEQAMTIDGTEPLHRRRPAAEDLRLLADHRRLRRADRSPPRRGSPGSGSSTDRRVELAGWAQATDPLRKGGRDVLRPPGRSPR